MVDVIEFLVDTVMAGMARSGQYHLPEIPDGLLQKAFRNTVDELIKTIKVVKDD